MEKIENRSERLEVAYDPTCLVRLGNELRIWHETPEEIEAGLEWGREKSRLLRWVRKWMGQRLTRRQRRCVELHFFRGLSYAEVGHATKTHPSAVSRAIIRAVTRLKEAAEEQQGTPEKAGRAAGRNVRKRY